MINVDDLIITPEYWFSGEIDSRKRYKYLAPDGTLWNIRGVVSGSEEETVQLWAINAWGKFIYRSVNYHQFMALYREYKP